MGIERADGASERFERLLTGGFVMAKVAAYVSLVISFGTSWRRIPRPGIAGLVVGLAGIQTAASVARVVRRRELIDRAIGRAEVVVATSMIVGEALSWGTRAFPPDPRLGLPHAVTIGAFLPALIPERSQVLRAVALPTVSFVISSSSRTVADPAGRRPSLRVSETFVLPLTAVLSHRLISELRLRARQQDEARAAAAFAAARSSAEHERQRQYRQLHDSALQVLETIAGGWDVDDSAILARIDQEIVRLERELSGSTEVSGRFDSEVTSLANSFALVGLSVEVRLKNSGNQEWMTSWEQNAFTGALREALNNVVKHSGAREAIVCVFEQSDRVTVTVSDQGTGFDIGRVSSGLGLTGSIVSRMNEVGGHVVIHSTPGQGTEVELWLTRS